MVMVQADCFDVKSIADSGQCFRLNEVARNEFQLIAGSRALRISEIDEGHFTFHCDEAEFQSIWVPYFDLEADYAGYIDSIPPEDIFLRQAATVGRGIRILRQDAWEMLITFILSQRKNIPAIKKAVETLCKRYGEPIKGAQDGLFAFPTASALRGLSEKELRDCALGYRCAYIQAAARMVADGDLDLQCLQSLGDIELQEVLLSVPGVGPKVASCVMLFGFHRIAAFPRDVWINRIITEEYAGHSPEHKYGGYAGVMQQYMFYYARVRAAERQHAR